MASSSFQVSCYACPWTGDTAAQLRHHVLSMHKDNDDGMRTTMAAEVRRCRGKSRQCKQCGSEQFGKRGMEEHMINEHKTCKECHIAFPTVNKLKVHLNVFHRNASFNCPICDAQFESKWRLKRHKKVTHETWKCDKCPASFTTKSDVLRHKTRMHKPENCCQFCGDEFSCSNKLRQHIINSHYKYGCFFCGDGFPTEQQLYAHQTQHCQNSVKCKHCDERFDDLVTCQRHELREHGKFGIYMEAIPTLSAIHKYVN